MASSWTTRRSRREQAWVRQILRLSGLPASAEPCGAYLICLPFGPASRVTSASNSSWTTAKPTPTDRANRPSLPVGGVEDRPQFLRSTGQPLRTCRRSECPLPSLHKRSLAAAYFATLRQSAKGLEFPVVAVAGFIDGLPPAGGRGAGEDETEEALARQRRTMFVAMTRAMPSLLVVTPDRPWPLFTGFDPQLWNTQAPAAV